MKSHLSRLIVPVALLVLSGADSILAQSPAGEDRAVNPGPERSAPSKDADAASANASGQSSCRQGDRGRLIRYERVASHPTAASARAYFDEWIAFYQDFYQFPPNIPVEFNYGFDSYKVTYCT
ncbi:MAG TPA: hypothetical protein VFV34_27195 [Blastocatellia bacterium]|nr:hypothetical protein [Blastocatellia bacterium]